MLFSKLKPKSDELLPPPPPFPSMELEEKEISRGISQKKAPKDDEFEDLFNEVKSLRKERKKAALPKPAKERKVSAKLPKEKIQVKKPIIKTLKKEILPIKKPSKAIKLALKKEITSKKQKMPAKMPEGFGIEELQIPESGEIKLEHGMEFPEVAKEPDLDFGNIGREYPENLEFDRELIQSKPREIQEAEDEIKSAIEKIKNNERPSFLKRLFAGKGNGNELPQIYEKDDVSAIQGRINMARESLMKFDIDGARKSYIEIMKIYRRITPEEQAKVYHEVKDLYFERKSAEQLNV